MPIQSPGLFPSCAVTQAMAKKAAEEPYANKRSEDILVNLSETFLATTDIDTVKNHTDKLVIQTETPNKEGKETLPNRAKLIKEQEKDPESTPLFQLTLPQEELDKVATGYYVNNGILMGKWRPAKVPSNEEMVSSRADSGTQNEILKLAHESLIGGHLGINKTLFKITAFTGCAPSLVLVRVSQPGPTKGSHQTTLVSNKSKIELMSLFKNYPQFPIPTIRLLVLSLHEP